MLNKQTFIDQLEKLVAYRTLPGDTKTNAKALDYIQSLLNTKAHTQRIQNGNTEILLASNTKDLSPDLGYLVHVDVVAASPALFKIKQKNSKVYGRGVSDMKFSIPIGVAHLNDLIKSSSSKTFTLAITTDEEVGGFEGAFYLANTIKWRPKALIVPDGGDNLRFVRASKGVAQFRISVFGTSAHASRPWQGNNAIMLMSRVIQTIEDRYGKNNLTENWNTTANFGTISGGISTNQVCDLATLEIDFRYPETDSYERIFNELQKIVDSIAAQNHIEPLSSGLPTATDTSLLVVQDFLKAFKETFQEEIRVEPNFGSSDARHFAPYDIPILMIKPNGGDIHMESEWLDVESTLLFYQALKKFVVGEGHV